MTKQRSYRWIWILAGLVVVGGGGYYLRKRFAGRQAPKYETTVVDRGPITAKVTATGTLSALVTVQVGTQVSGRIEKIMVDFNSTVIFSIRPDTWVPTWTVTSADKVPVAVTLAVIGPRSTTVVSYFGP